MKRVLTHADVTRLAIKLVQRLEENSFIQEGQIARIHPIPRGGVSAAYALIPWIPAKYSFTLVSDPSQADFFIDDIIDSGETAQRFKEEFGKPTFALIENKLPTDWIVFPWEVAEEGQGLEDNIRRMLQFIGEDAGREGLKETPARVAKAWGDWCSGYGKDAGKILKVFEDGAEQYDQMVVVKDIPVYSHCEHHLAAIIGTASIAYIPNGKIVGLSKLSRLTDMFARRLQVQERLTSQIADALVEHLKPTGVGVLIKARHLCMESRGVCQQGHHTVTTALRGAILNEEQTRAEFLKLVC